LIDYKKKVFYLFASVAIIIVLNSYFAKNKFSNQQKRYKANLIYRDESFCFQLCKNLCLNKKFQLLNWYQYFDLIQNFHLKILFSLYLTHFDYHAINAKMFSFPFILHGVSNAGDEQIAIMHLFFVNPFVFVMLHPWTINLSLKGPLYRASLFGTSVGKNLWKVKEKNLLKLLKGLETFPWRVLIRVMMNNDLKKFAIHRPISKG